MSLLATAGEDVRIWKVPELSLHTSRNGANANILHCSCSPNGQLVAYTYEEEGIRVGSLFDDDLPLIEIPTPCEQSSVGFNGNSRYIVSGGLDCVINIWDIKSSTAKRTYKDHRHPITFCQFNYNDNLIASANDHGEILLLNVQKGDVFSLTGHDDSQAIRCMGYSYFSRSLLASASDSGAVCLWDAKERKLLKKFTDHKAPSTCLAFSPLNDMLLCSSGLDKRIIFYDVTGKKTVKTINTEGPITSCDFFNDGCTVAAGSASGHIYLFDLRHGSIPVKVVSAHKTSVRSISFQKIPKESKSPKKSIEEAKSTVAVRSERKSSSSDPSNDVLASSMFNSSDRMFTSDIPQSPSRENVSNIFNSVDRPPLPSTDRPPLPSTDRPPLPSTDRPPIPSTDRPPLPSTDRPPLPKVRPQDNQAFVRPNMMGGRENSTMALNRLINLNQTPEQAAAKSAIPPKAARLMGDEIFSPIALDYDQSRSSTLPRKLKASKQKSLGKSLYNTETEEPERPSYGRSKSGLSRLSMLAKSTEDIHSIKKEKKEKDLEGNDLNDGKRSSSGLLSGFKSPFKKNKKNNAYNKHSDESETSSIDSLSLEDRSSYIRGKKDRSSNRSNESFGTNVSRKISNGGVSSSASMMGFNKPIDTNQLMMDIQNSLAQQSDNISKSPSIHSGDFSHITNPAAALSSPEMYQYANNVAAPSQIQVDFIQKMIDEAMEENRAIIHGDMVNLQIELLRQMEIQKTHIGEMLHKTSINGDLLVEIDRLRVENERLKNKY